MNQLIKQICERHQLKYKEDHGVSGGDINQTFLVVTDNGNYFLKINDASAFPQMFEKEAEGLQALREATDLKVPQVIANGEIKNKQYLLLEYLVKGSPGDNFWQQFANGLVQLHKSTCDSFGYKSDNYIGSLMQANVGYADWATFYGEQRIMPLVKKLFNTRIFSALEIRNAERLSDRIKNIFPDEPPALLHGDLWGGNFMVAVSRNSVLPAIFDPAVYYGHREMDIGMTLLFGGFDYRFYDAYHAGYPLTPGWKQRVDLTQLYPLLVHAVLFGGSYISRVKQILGRFA